MSGWNPPALGSFIVSATGLGNQPAVRDWTTYTVPFGSCPVQKPHPEHRVQPNQYTYLAPRGFIQVWVD